MKKRIYACVLVAFLFIVVACAQKYIWKSDPDTKEVKNEYFSAQISPIFIFRRVVLSA